MPYSFSSNTRHYDLAMLEQDNGQPDWAGFSYHYTADRITLPLFDESTTGAAVTLASGVDEGDDILVSDGTDIIRQTVTGSTTANTYEPHHQYLGSGTDFGLPGPMNCYDEYGGLVVIASANAVAYVDLYSRTVLDTFTLPDSVAGTQGVGIQALTILDDGAVMVVTQATATTDPDIGRIEADRATFVANMEGVSKGRKCQMARGVRGAVWLANIEDATTDYLGMRLISREGVLLHSIQKSSVNSDYMLVVSPSGKRAAGVLKNGYFQLVEYHPLNGSSNKAWRTLPQSLALAVPYWLNEDTLLITGSISNKPVMYVIGVQAGAVATVPPVTQLFPGETSMSAAFARLAPTKAGARFMYRGGSMGDVTAIDIDATGSPSAPYADTTPVVGDTGYNIGSVYGLNDPPRYCALGLITQGSTSDNGTLYLSALTDQRRRIIPVAGLSKAPQWIAAAPRLALGVGLEPVDSRAAPSRFQLITDECTSTRLVAQATDGWAISLTDSFKLSSGEDLPVVTVDQEIALPAMTSTTLLARYASLPGNKTTPAVVFPGEQVIVTLMQASATNHELWRNEVETAFPALKVGIESGATLTDAMGILTSKGTAAFFFDSTVSGRVLLEVDSNLNTVRRVIIPDNEAGGSPLGMVEVHPDVYAIMSRTTTTDYCTLVYHGQSRKIRSMSDGMHYGYGANRIMRTRNGLLAFLLTNEPGGSNIYRYMYRVEPDGSYQPLLHDLLDTETTGLQNSNAAMLEFTDNGDLIYLHLHADGTFESQTFSSGGSMVNQSSGLLGIGMDREYMQLVNVGQNKLMAICIGRYSYKQGYAVLRYDPTSRGLEVEGAFRLQPISAVMGGRNYDTKFYSGTLYTATTDVTSDTHTVEKFRCGHQGRVTLELDTPVGVELSDELAVVITPQIDQYAENITEPVTGKLQFSSGYIPTPKGSRAITPTIKTSGPGANVRELTVSTVNAQ